MASDYRHSYERRFNVGMNRWSSYHDTAQEVLDRIGDDVDQVEYITEGYADFRDHPDGTEIIRMTDRFLKVDEVREIARRDAVEAEVARHKAEMARLASA